MRAARIDAGGWVVTPRPQPAPRVRLLCFPYAGGGPGVFRPWARFLPDGAELSVVQLPGRDRRAAEPPLHDIPTMIARLGPELRRFAGTPLVLFGHSLGARLAYETAHWLRANGQPPALLAVSGWAAPHLRLHRTAPDTTPTHLLPEDQFVDAVLSMDGTPPEVLQHPELRAMFLPILRADFAAAANYRHEPRPPLDCPVTAFTGTHDPYAPASTLPEWSHYTLGRFQHQAFPGNHFFLRDHRDALLRALLAPWAVARP